ncbi:metal-dependent phosphohydrolase [Hoeflea sp. CAU 1731]
MYNPSTVVASTFADHLTDTYLRFFSGRKPAFGPIIGNVARLALERLNNSDALYHNTEHTIMVTLVGQQIIEGRLLTASLEPEDWAHYILALLMHDIGYTRGICEGDGPCTVVINEKGDTIMPQRGASDASLAPFHVDRGKIFVRERFANVELIDHERIARAIECTRFPVPDDPDYLKTDTEPALVRAADLIGQMADPYYHRKINALYYEFTELGVTDMLEYTSPMDMVERYPQFFWSKVQPYIGPALNYLEQTLEGKQWVAQLYNHVIQSENKTGCMGPFPGPAEGEAE